MTEMKVVADIWENGKKRRFDGVVQGTDIEAGIKAVRAEVDRTPEKIEVISSMTMEEHLAQRNKAIAEKEQPAPEPMPEE